MILRLATLPLLSLLILVLGFRESADGFDRAVNPPPQLRILADKNGKIISQQSILKISELARLSETPEIYHLKKAGYLADIDWIATGRNLKRAIIFKANYRVSLEWTEKLFRHPKGFFIALKMGSDLVPLFFYGFEETEVTEVLKKFRKLYADSRFKSWLLAPADASEVAVPTTTKSGQGPSKSAGADRFDYAFSENLGKCMKDFRAASPKEAKSLTSAWGQSVVQWESIKETVLKFEASMKEQNKFFVGSSDTEKSSQFCEYLTRSACEMRRSQYQCAEFEKEAKSDEEKKKFLSCHDSKEVKKLFNKDQASLMYPCAAGVGGVFVDAVMGLIALPQAAWEAVQKFSNKAPTVDCSSDMQTKLAIIGTLRPASMSQQSLERMSCDEVRKFSETKASTIIQKLQDRRLAEATRTGNDNLTIDDLKLSHDEVQALNFDLKRSKVLRKAQCLRPEEAAKFICGTMFEAASTVAGAAGSAAVLRKSTKDVRLPLSASPIPENSSHLSSKDRIRISIVEAGHSGTVESAGRELVGDMANFEKLSPEFDLHPDVAVGKRLVVVYTDGKAVFQDVKKISEEPKQLRNIYKDLKRRSFAGHPSPAKEREVGAYVIEFSDGSYQTLRMTSNELAFIGTDALNAPFQRPRNPKGLVLKGGHMVSDIRKIQFIHTHPNPVTIKKFFPDFNPVQELSRQDIKMLDNMAPQLRNILGNPNLKVDGIVLPNCDTCQDVYFRYEVP